MLIFQYYFVFFKEEKNAEGMRTFCIITSQGQMLFSPHFITKCNMRAYTV